MDSLEATLERAAKPRMREDRQSGGWICRDTFTGSEGWAPSQRLAFECYKLAVEDYWRQQSNAPLHV